MRRYLDWANREITVGCRVAYNFMGRVVPGRVVHITRGGTFLIELEGRFRGKDNHLSRVHSEQSILVISRPIEDSA